MVRRLIRTMLLPAALLVLVAGLQPAGGNEFDLTWHTVDGGGMTPMVGGGFELNATLAQADAGTLSGNGFELVGGFWAFAPQYCSLPADMNSDGFRDALDIQGFVDCVVGGVGSCDCAQLDGVGGVNLNDLAYFVEQMLEDEE